MSTQPKRDRLFLILIGAAALVLGGFAVYVFTSTAPTTPTTPAVAQASMPQTPLEQAASCRYDPSHTAISDFRSLIDTRDARLGNEDASVVVIEFFEPNCPHCKTFHPIMKEVARLHGDKAQFVIKPVVFWPRSSLQAQAIYAAHQEGKFFEMVERQFDVQRPEGLGEPEVRSIAQSIGMNADALMQSIRAGNYSAMMNIQRAHFQQSGLTAVPAVLINGRAVEGTSRTVACLGQLITAAANGQ